MKSNQIASLLGIGCFGFMLVGAISSQGQGGTEQASAADKAFVRDALKGGKAEVELGELASKKGNSEEVKQFGQKMVEDHTKLGDQMAGVAGQIGVDPPSMLSPKDNALKLKLESLSGDAFDKAYINAMVTDHQKDLSAFRREVTGGTSPAVKSAAKEGEHVVAMHLEMIQKIAQSHNLAAK
jgi:putative membrane protein